MGIERALAPGNLARSEGRQSLEDLVAEHDVLELLLAQHLSRFLTATNQVWHHYLGGTVRQEFVDLMVGKSQLVRDLVREALQLSEADTVVVDALLAEGVLSQLDRVDVVAAQQ